MTDDILHEGRFLRLKRRGRWEFAQRTNASAVVAIAARTVKDEVVLIEQQRLPLGSAGERVIELPAGLVGDDGLEDDVCAAANRELIEETGFQAATLHIAGVGPSSAGLCDELITMIIATDLERVGPGGGLPDEDITVHLVPWTEIDSWLNERSAAGTLIDPKVWAGLYLLSVKR